ncbi:hypothetical protein, partial [Roseibium sp.]|uniref:hypothetical protein n=1 Tax=Roseibium sp. TaxID=1936156 RepID=UPI0032973993
RAARPTARARWRRVARLLSSAQHLTNEAFRAGHTSVSRLAWSDPEVAFDLAHNTLPSKDKSTLCMLDH